MVFAVSIDLAKLGEEKGCHIRSGGRTDSDLSGGGTGNLSDHLVSTCHFSPSLAIIV